MSASHTFQISANAVASSVSIVEVLLKEVLAGYQVYGYIHRSHWNVHPCLETLEPQV